MDAAKDDVRAALAAAAEATVACELAATMLRGALSDAPTAPESLAVRSTDAVP